MASQIVAPKINAQLKNKILRNQDNQCARRPYARLEEPFKNHMCHLWKKNGRAQGKFSNGEYTIVKIDNDSNFFIPKRGITKQADFLTLPQQLIDLRSKGIITITES